MELIIESESGEYKLKKTGKKQTAAHPDGKATYDIHHNGQVIGKVEPYSAYKDTKKPGSRIVSKRKDVTRYSFTFHKDHGPAGHEMGTYMYMDRTSPKHALETAEREHKRWKQKNESVEIDEALDLQQRQKRAMIFRRYKAKIERSRELAKKRMAPDKNIKQRAYAQARQIVRRKVAGKRGAEYEKLGPTEKMIIDKMVEKRQKLIKKIALRLMPRVKQDERKRLQSFMKGQSMENHGAPEGHKTHNESLNNDFTKTFLPLVEKMVDGTGEPVKKPKAKKNSPIIQHAKFDEERMCKSSAYKAIAKKAKKSGISEDILGEVYNRGLDSWNEESGITQQQYAFARVNSYINQGKTYFNEDADLHEGIMKSIKRGLQGWEKGMHDVDTVKAATKTLSPEQKKQALAAKVSKGSPAELQQKLIKRDLRKEEVDQIDEVSLDTLDRYIDKASNDRTKQFGNERKYNNRLKGVSLALKKGNEKAAKEGPKKLKPIKTDYERQMDDAHRHIYKEDLDEGTIKVGTYMTKSGDALVLHKAEHDPKHHMLIRKSDGKVVAGHQGTSQEVHDKLTKEGLSGSLHEGREPGKAYVKRTKRNDGSSMIVSSDKWGHKKFWRDSEGGLKKAREHAKVDTIDEARLPKPEVGSHHHVDEDGSIGRHVVTGVHDGVVYTQNIKTKEKFDTPLRHWHSSSSPIKEDTEMSLYDKIQSKRAEMRKNPEPEKEPPYKRKPALTAHDRDRRRLDREDRAGSSSRIREETQIDELTKNTLHKYVSKAFKDVGDRAEKLRAQSFGNTTMDDKEYDAEVKKQMNRGKGINTALAKAGYELRGSLRKTGVKVMAKEEAKKCSECGMNPCTCNHPRKKMDTVERSAPNDGQTRQGEIKRKIIEGTTGNSQNDANKREIGTDSLVQAFKKDTPGQSAKVNEMFKDTFAKPVDEEVKAGDKQPVVVPAHTDAFGHTIPAKTVMRKTGRKILKTGNSHDGK